MYSVHNIVRSVLAQLQLQPSVCVVEIFPKEFQGIRYFSRKDFPPFFSIPSNKWNAKMEVHVSPNFCLFLVFLSSNFLTLFVTALRPFNSCAVLKVYPLAHVRQRKKFKSCRCVAMRGTNLCVDCSIATTSTASQLHNFLKLQQIEPFSQSQSLSENDELLNLLRHASPRLHEECHGRCVLHWISHCHSRHIRTA